VALPVAEARLKAGDVDLSKAVRAQDKAAVFKVFLKAGRTRLQRRRYSRFS